MLPYLFVVTLGIVQFALGLLLGAWWRRRGAAVPGQVELDAAWLRGLVGKLRQLATNVADDVGQYHQRLAVTTDRLAEAAVETPNGQASPLAEIVVGVVSEVVDLNGHLQGKLAMAEQRLEHQTRQIESYLSEARTDGLTQLPNRRALDDELSRSCAQARRRGTPLSFMFVDVDHFKTLNDRHGHLVGDQVLAQLARVLRETVRETDVVARFGGEEFSAVMRDTDREQALAAAERARLAVCRTPFRVDVESGSGELPVTVSIGVAMLGADDDIASFVGRADAALYASKHAGRNCGHFHNGQWCEPIGDNQLLSGGAVASRLGPSDSGVELPPLSAELAQACHGLRQRVAELASSGSREES